MAQLLNPSEVAAAMSQDLAPILDAYIGIINAELNALDSGSSGAVYEAIEADLEAAVAPSPALNNAQRDLIAQGFLDHAVARGWIAPDPTWSRIGVGTNPKLRVTLPAAGVPVPSL